MSGLSEAIASRSFDRHGSEEDATICPERNCKQPGKLWY